MSILKINKDLALKTLDALGSSSNLFISQVKELIKSSDLSIQDSCLLCDGYSLLEDSGTLSQSLEQAYMHGSRIMLPRLENDPEKFNPNVYQCLSDSFDSCKSHILSGLATPAQNNIIHRAPRHWAKTLFLLGAPLLAALNFDTIPSWIDRIVVIESRPRDLAIGLCLSDLLDIVEKAKVKNVGLQLLFESDLDALKNKIREQFVVMQPTALNGILLCLSPLDNPGLKILTSWLKSPEGITQAVQDGLGGETDELNQLLQALFTGSRTTRRSLASTQPLRVNQPIVIIGSGPSLDESLEWLKRYQGQLQIVSAGSSLGTLLRNDIKPNAAVFLERSSVVHDRDLMELVEEGFDLSEIPLIASMTLDPRIPTLFKSTVWFHRPLSTALALYSDEAFAKLLQSGPQSANAALEAMLHLGHKRFLIIGCDFSASKRNYPRSLQAIGKSPRQLDLPLPGRHGRTVFSSPELSNAAEYFANALRVYGAEVYSPSAGVSLESINVNLVDLNQDIADLFLNQVPLFTDWDLLPVGSVSNTELSTRVELAFKACKEKLLNLKTLVTNSNHWSLEFSRDLDAILQKEEGGLSPSEALAKRLCYFPLLATIQSLHDSLDDQWDKNSSICISNLEWLDSLYSNYFLLLLKIMQEPTSSELAVSSFSWDTFKKLILDMSKSSS